MADHTHQHHHAPKPLSYDPASGAPARHRQSPYEMKTFTEAVQLVLKNVSRLDTVEKRVNFSLRGFILAEDVYAPSDIPRTSTTNVDGYALDSSLSPGNYPVVIGAPATSAPVPSVYRVNTGAPIPPHCDAVIMVEDTRLTKTEDGEEIEIETLARVPAEENIRAPGSDVRSGDLVLRKGDVIGNGGDVGTLAFVSRRQVKVFKKPVVSIFSTGNEIIDLHNPVPQNESDWSGIYDTNRPSLRALLESFGYEVIDLGVIPDNTEKFSETIRTGIAKSDLVLTTGGTSMGTSDLFKPVVERLLGGTIYFGRVSVKPGKPTTFATVEGKPVFALPGNPASALVCFHLFVLPALRVLGGWSLDRCTLPRVKAIARNTLRLDTVRPEYHRVVLRASPDGGLEAYSTGGQRSSRIASLCGANAFAALPVRLEGGPSSINIGDAVECVLIGEILPSHT